jgi:hypothetical protein
MSLITSTKPHWWTKFTILGQIQASRIIIKLVSIRFNFTVSYFSAFHVDVSQKDRTKLL